MKVSACSGVGYGVSPKINHSPSIKSQKSAYKVIGNEAAYDPEYTRGLKRLSFVVGMSSLAAMSFVLATAGKVCNHVRV